MIILHLPLPPSVNNYYQKNRFNVRINSKSQAYINKQSEEISRQYGGDILSNTVRLDICLHPKDKRKMDADNRLKCLFDLLIQAEVIGDDDQIDTHKVIKVPYIRKDNGLCIVVIRPNNFMKEHKKFLKLIGER